MFNIEDDKLKIYLEKKLKTKVELNIDPTLTYSTMQAAEIIGEIEDNHIRYYLKVLPEYIESKKSSRQNMLDATNVFRLYLVVLFLNHDTRSISKIRTILELPLNSSEQESLDEKVYKLESELEDLKEMLYEFNESRYTYKPVNNLVQDENDFKSKSKFNSYTNLDIDNIKECLDTDVVIEEIRNNKNNKKYLNEIKNKLKFKQKELDKSLKILSLFLEEE